MGMTHVFCPSETNLISMDIDIDTIYVYQEYIDILIQH